MLSHDQVWTAIDALAARHGMTVSGLAKAAGLDPTSFNKSKRVADKGRLRWPSTESIAKALRATGASLDEFMGLLSGRSGIGGSRATAGGGRYEIPLLGLARAGVGGFFDDGGFPTGQGWDEIAFPASDADGAYALEVSGDSMLPLYRDGDVIIVQPGAAVRRGDRVVVKTKAGEVMAKILSRQTAKRVELMSLNPHHPDRTVPAEEIDWIARIVWASQ